MNSGFDKSGFMDYLQSNFTMNQRYALDMIDNIIQYGIQKQNVSRDQLVWFLYDILPDISFKEIAVYCDDDKLTAYGLSEKKGVPEI